MRYQLRREIGVAVEAGSRKLYYRYSLRFAPRTKRPWVIWLDTIDKPFRRFVARDEAEKWLDFMAAPYNVGYERQRVIFDKSYD